MGREGRRDGQFSREPSGLGEPGRTGGGREEKEKEEAIHPRKGLFLNVVNQPQPVIEGAYQGCGWEHPSHLLCLHFSPLAFNIYPAGPACLCLPESPGIHFFMALAGGIVPEWSFSGVPSGPHFSWGRQDALTGCLGLVLGYDTG